MATEALKTAYHFTEVAVQPWVILQLCKGKDGRDTSQELLTNPLTPKQHARSTDLLGKGTEARSLLRDRSGNVLQQPSFPSPNPLSNLHLSPHLLTCLSPQLWPPYLWSVSGTTTNTACSPPCTQESTKNSFTMLFSIWQFPKLLSTAAALPWWQSPEECQGLCLSVSCFLWKGWPCPGSYLPCSHQGS